MSYLYIECESIVSIELASQQILKVLFIFDWELLLDHLLEVFIKIVPVVLDLEVLWYLCSAHWAL